MKDGVADLHNEDSPAVVVLGSEKTRNAKHVQGELAGSNAAAEECDKMATSEVLLEDQLDRGYSWVVVCASFINCFIVGTMLIGFSILYVEITEYFGSSKGVAGWIGSLYMAVGNIFGEKYHVSCY